MLNVSELLDIATILDQKGEYNLASAIDSIANRIVKGLHSNYIDGFKDYPPDEPESKIPHDLDDRVRTLMREKFREWIHQPDNDNWKGYYELAEKCIECLPQFSADMEPEDERVIYFMRSEKFWTSQCYQKLEDEYWDYFERKILDNYNPDDEALDYYADQQEDY